MDTGSSPGSTLQTVDQIVVSVGPYMFQNEPLRSSSWSASSRDKASPPQSTFNCGLPCQPASISILQVAGVAWITFVPVFASRSFN